MSRLYRRVFILNFLILFISFSIYSYFTFTLFEKDFIYLFITLFVFLILSTYLVVKVAVTPSLLNLLNSFRKFCKFINIGVTATFTTK
jgi:hypothetical protein